MATEARRPDPLAELAGLVREPGAALPEVQAFGPKPGPKRVEIADMELPPPELVDELDNTKAAAPEPEPEDEPVTLDFFGDDLPVFTRILKHPFVWRETGERVEAIEVHQLGTAEAGAASVALAAAGSYTIYDVYARMCRVRGSGTLLPARVLRKLPAVDGYPIVDAAYDFLPPSFRAEGG